MIKAVPATALTTNKEEIQQSKAEKFRMEATYEDTKDYSE